MKRLAALAALLALVAAAPAQAGVSKADRAAVNRLLDKFVPAVLVGKDLQAGKALVGGYVTVGSVQHYPADGTTFHGWLLNYASPGDVGFDITIQPTNKRKLGAWSFRAEAQKLKGRWVITDWYPVAQYQPVGKQAFVVGPNDFSPAARGGPTVKNTGYWLWVPFAGFALLVLVIAGFTLSHWLRSRSKVRAIERTLASTR